MAKENSNKRARENTVETPHLKRIALQDTTNTQASSVIHANKIVRIDNYFDIDKNNRQDPTYVTSYVQEIYTHLYSSEVVIKNYIPQFQKDINQRMRKILMDWIVDVAEQYEISSKSLFLGKKIIDTTLSKLVISRNKLQLLGVSSLFIASKFEDITPPAIDQLTFISDNSCSQAMIKELEVEILNTLSYNITIPTEMDFLPRYLSAATYSLSEKEKERICFLANYFCEVTILYYTFLKYKSSTIAIACVSLALATAGLEVWTPTLDHYYPYRDFNFSECMKEIMQHLRMDDDNSVRRKYSQPLFGSVSEKLIVPDSVPLFNIH